MTKKARFWCVFTEPYTKKPERFMTLEEARNRAKRLSKDADEVYVFELKEALITEHTSVNVEVVDGEHQIQDLEEMEHAEPQEEEREEGEGIDPLQRAADRLAERFRYVRPPRQGDAVYGDENPENFIIPQVAPNVRG